MCFSLKLLPIPIMPNIWQDRKACTLITRFELYQLSAETLAEELHHAGARLEVMVQGRQVKAARELLGAKGVPEKWIESDLTGKKKHGRFVCLLVFIGKIGFELDLNLE